MSQLYPTGEGPRYVKGHAVSMSLVASGAVLYAGMHFYFKFENRRRAKGQRDHVMEGRSEDEVLALGDENPRFVFAA